MTAARPAVPALHLPRERTAPGSAVAVRRAAVPSRAGAFDRERHQPDYSILVAVVALAAVGILMVYSSSAMKSLLQRDDSLAIVGPQILWACVGLLVMLL